MEQAIILSARITQFLPRNSVVCIIIVQIRNRPKEGSKYSLAILREAPGINMSNAPSARKRVVLTTFGSLGDLHPALALALELKARGHTPVLATSEAYRSRAEALDIEFFPVRPDLPVLDDPHTAGIIARSLDVKHGAEYLLRNLLLPTVRAAYADLSIAIRGADLLVTHPITFAGPILAQTTHIPWVSTVLAPFSLWSNHDPLVLAYLPWFHAAARLGGPVATRGLRKAIDFISDPWMQPLYEFRQELGLPRGRHPAFEGQYSPQLNLGLFSQVLCEPQPDWPANTHVTGFPFFDDNAGGSLAPALQHFLDAGAAPLVFTLGSAAVHIAGDFFEESIAAATLLERRAVLLVGHNVPKPATLPADIVAFDYAPHGELFPRAACIVHQGGVGTTGQALRSGVPTLIVPFGHDQPDNAARIARLGTGRTLARGHYCAARVAMELEVLLQQPAYAERARAVGRTVRAEQGAARAVDLMLTRLDRSTGA